jgi:protein NrfD
MHVQDSPEAYPDLPRSTLPVEFDHYRGESYYGIPPIKHSHYRWRTATAFTLNGLGGGSQILATLLDVLGGPKDRSLVRTGRYIAFAGGLASSVTLISSLHKWERWYNMLRIFKETSPMSLGIWAITPFSMLSSLTLVGQIAEDHGHEKAGRWIGRTFGIPAAALGSMVISYMGTELEETNMPLWASAHPLMAPLYAAAGLSGSTEILLSAAQISGSSDRMRRSLSTFAVVSSTAELALSSMIERRWSRLPEAAVFENSPYASLFRIGVMGVGQAVPLMLRLFDKAVTDGRLSRLTVPGSVLKIAGSLLLQMVLIYSGRESGRRALDYFEYTRHEKRNDGNGTYPQYQEIERGSAPEQKMRPKNKKPNISTIVGLGMVAMSLGYFAASLGRKRGN